MRDRASFEPAHRGNFLRAIRDGAGDPPDARRYALAPSQVDRISDAFHRGGLDLRTAWAAVLGHGRAT